MELIIALVLSITGLIMGILGLCLGIYSVIELKALKNSTHSIQYVPAPMPNELKTDEKLSQDFKKAGVMAEPFDEYPTDVIL